MIQKTICGAGLTIGDQEATPAAQHGFIIPMK
jgi:hypothetical protein